jgi:hypothetical protein
MKRLLWQLQHLSQAVGLPGWVGVALLAACGLGWGLSDVPLKGETARLDAISDSLERSLAARAGVAITQPLTPTQQLAEFQRRFVGEKQLAGALRRLQAAAKRQGVQIEQAEFRLASDVGEPLMRYTIVLPVKADYRALRRFTREALLALPGLAIEEVNLRRNDAKATALEAQLRFVLFMTKPG